MEKRTLGKTGIEVTPIGMGVLNIGHNQLNLSIEEGSSIIKYALQKGINFLDTAEYYETYKYIVAALKDTPYRPVISSKSLTSDYDEMKQAVYDALDEMNLDYIDIFLLHEVQSKWDFKFRKDAWQFLKEAKSQGLVKAIGISTHCIDAAQHIAEVPEVDILFPLINKDGLGIRDGEKPGKKEDMELAIYQASEAGKGVYAMKVFGGGNLTGSYLDCLDYVNNLQGVDSMMIGMGKKDEVDRIVEYANGTIDRNYVPDISRKRIRIDQGDCIACGLCIQRCPNNAISSNPNGISQIDESICLNCGYCAPVCPTRAIIMF